MKAQFVYENVNEDYSGFQEIHKLSYAIPKWLKKKGIDLTKPESYDEIYIVGEMINPKEYPKLKDFIKDGLGIILLSPDNSSKESAGFISPDDYSQYITDKKELKEAREEYKSGIILFFGRPVLLAHELQHAYDYWISSGKNKRKNRSYGSKEIEKLSRADSGYGKYDPELSSYYLDPREINAYFLQSISGHNWAGPLRNEAERKNAIPYNNTNFGFYNWDHHFYWFQKAFDPWQYLGDKEKKKYANKFYTYYDKIKEIWKKEGIEGFKKRNMKMRGNPDNMDLYKKK